MRWSLHRNLEDNPSCSVSLIRALITELDKLIQIHETRSYTHTIPALHTLSYVVMQVRRSCVTLITLCCLWKILNNGERVTICRLRQKRLRRRLFCFSTYFSSQVSWFRPAFTRSYMSAWWNCWCFRLLILLWPWALWEASRWRWPHQVSCTHLENAESNWFINI